MLAPRVQAARAEAFNLAEGPLLRARLLRLAADDHVLLLLMHHIVVDAWSLGVLWRELGVLYESYREARPSPLPPLRLQYADYAVWERQWLQGAVLDEHLTYWRGQLAGVPELKLPIDSARPAQTTGHGTLVQFSLGPELTARVKALGRAEGVTLFMTLLAAFQVVLGRQAQQELFAIGTPIAGRTRPEVEPLIGCFINMLALRVDLRGNPTFRELLGRVRETCLGAYAHQDLPFERLVDDLQLARDSTRAPLTEVTFGVQNVPRTTLTLADLAVEQLFLSSETSRHDLTLWAIDAIDDLHFSWSYRPELFNASTIARYQNVLRLVLERLVEAPGSRIKRIRASSDKEYAAAKSRREAKAAAKLPSLNR
jgi:surfactin family lipopeptide synthetase A